MANSAIFSYRGVPVPHRYLQPGIFSEIILMSFIYQKLHLFGNFEVNFQLLTPLQKQITLFFLKHECTLLFNIKVTKTERES